jgi:predicted DNA-binding transcriptional regulator AlpA
MPTPFFSATQLCQRWAVSTRTLYNWRKQKKGPACFKVGHQYRYPVSAIEAYEQQSFHSNGE